jgi:2-aminoethylphosphonate-pyruvate transaminase
LRHARTRAFYLDLATWCKSQDERGTPFTPAVQSFYALDEALNEFADQGGWQARNALYRERSARIEAVLERLGVKPLLLSVESSVVLRAWHLPPGIGYAQLHDALKARGFVIYAGQGKLGDWMFRISPMGKIGDRDLDRLEVALEAAIGAA